jgi:hypothetical protein
MILSYFTARLADDGLWFPDNPEKRLHATALRLLRSASFFGDNIE